VLFGRPHAFDLSGRPPARLLLAAWLLCARDDEANGWMLRGASEEQAEGAASFAQLPLPAQLSPPRVRTSPRALLLAAVQAQAARLPPDAGARVAGRPEVAQSAATLVAGQPAVWRVAEAYLAPPARADVADDHHAPPAPQGAPPRALRASRVIAKRPNAVRTVRRP